MVSVAIERGYLTMPEGMLIEPREVDRLPPEKVVILCTGSQGEPMAALSRLASGNFRDVCRLSRRHGYFSCISNTWK